MKTYNEKETECSKLYAGLDSQFHLWTPENFEVIFRDENDFKIGMNIIAVASRLHGDVKILTFELMTNHIHVTAIGPASGILSFFESFKKMLVKAMQFQGRIPDWKKFAAKIRKIGDLRDLRNVIVYDNRNGFIVNPDYTPFTYPWGANRYFYNPDAKAYAKKNAVRMNVRELRKISHMHTTDTIFDLYSFDGCALPLSFCDIETGEKLFRDASHYFYSLSKNVEANKAIAQEIGESVYFTDEELFSILVKTSKEKFSVSAPTLLSPASKIELAKFMHWEYNASSKQLQRMLKLSSQVLESLGF